MIERFDYGDVVALRLERGTDPLQDRGRVLDTYSLSRERGFRPFRTTIVPRIAHDLEKNLQRAHHNVMGIRQCQHIFELHPADLGEAQIYPRSPERKRRIAMTWPQQQPGKDDEGLTRGKRRRRFSHIGKNPSAFSEAAETRLGWRRTMREWRVASLPAPPRVPPPACRRDASVRSDRFAGACTDLPRRSCLQRSGRYRRQSKKGVSLRPNAESQGQCGRWLPRIFELWRRRTARSQG